MSNEHYNVENILKNYLDPYLTNLQSDLSPNVIQGMKEIRKQVFRHVAEEVGRTTEFAHILDEVKNKSKDASFIPGNTTYSSQKNEEDYELTSLPESSASAVLREIEDDEHNDSIHDCSLNPLIIEQRSIPFSCSVFSGGLFCSYFTDLSSVEEEEESKD